MADAANPTATPAPATPATPAPAAPATPAPAAPGAQASPATGDHKPVEGQTGTVQPTNSGTGTTGSAQSQGLGGILPMLLMVAVFIAMFWWMSRSQKKREREHQEMLNRLKVGDRVMTGGGIIGEVAELHNDEVSLRIDTRKDVRMRVKRQVIIGPAGEASSDQALKEQQQK